MNSPAYTAGAKAALEKLGFTDAIDPEDLPEFLAAIKRKELQRRYRLNMATGFPAGGLVMPGA